MELKAGRYVEYVFIAVCVAALGLSVATLNVYLISATSAAALISFVLYKAWSVIEAKIFENSNLVQLFGGFELSGGRQAIIAKSGDMYTATSVARVDAVGDVEMDTGKIESLIARINAPFKLVLHVEKLNVSRLVGKMETRKGMKEIELARIPSPGSGKGLVAANRLKSEIAYLEHEIAGIAGGGIPLKLAYHIMTSASSEGRYKAEEESKMQLRELVSEFDATFRTKSTFLSGEELVKAMRFDSVIA